MFKRIFLILAIALLGMMVLSACGSAQPASDSPQDTSPQAAESDSSEQTESQTTGSDVEEEAESQTTESDADEKKGPQEAKKLTVGIWNTAGNITTYTIGNSWNDWVLWLSFDKLREPSPYVGEAEGWLAESIEMISDDARTWEIKLRDGVKWHDGTPLTAEDVAFTFVYYREGPANRWTHHCSAVPRMEEVEVIDPLTVRVTSAKPMPNFDRITAADLPIIQKAQWENVDEPRKFSDIAIGTGPFKMVEYKPDEYYKFVANEDYFKGKPLVDELTLVMIKDPQTMFTALKSGEIDGAARSLPPELLAEWENDPDIKIMNAPTLWGVWLDLNLGREPFIEREVRQAISLAVNPDPMLETIMLNKGQSGLHGWPHPDSEWTDPNLEQPYDQAKAIALLDELGYADTDGDGFRESPAGEPIDWNIKVASNQPLYARAAEMIVDQLAEVGLKTHVETMDPASFAGLWSSGEYDMRAMEITPHGIADQDMLIILYNVDNKRALEPDPDKDEIVARWFEAGTKEDRLVVSYELQNLNNLYPNRRMLWYPDGMFAYRWEAYDNYESSPGYGIYHKYSFLPNEARGKAVAAADE
jgi:peptide/nickel transport system substrate-binding protein